MDIDSGTITGITDLAVADGGTGASSASDARTNLGLAIGSDVQAYDADLNTIAGLAKDDGNFIVGSGSAWVAESGSTARTSIGLGNVTKESKATMFDAPDFTGTVDIECDSNSHLSIANAGTNLVQVYAGSGEGVYFGNANGALYIKSDGKPHLTTIGTETQTTVCWRGSDGMVTKASSSLRYKTNVTNSVINCDLVEQLNLKDFNWKESGNPGHGFIAEEVYPIIPEIVFTDEIDGETVCESINYDGLTAILVEYVKTLNDRITALEGA